MRKPFGWLILLGAIVALSGCAERYYRPYYGDGGYYRDYRHHRDWHHDDDDHYRFHHDRDDYR